MMLSPGRHFEHAAPGYLAAAERWPWGWVRAAEWRAIRAALDLGAGQQVLDAGCGAGFFARRMAAEAAVGIEGIDASAAMVEAFRQLGFPGWVDRAETFVGEHPYDRVLAAGVLEFVEHPERALGNLARLLRPGGRLVCLVPAGGPAGAVYRAVHLHWGCPTWIRPPRRYAALGAEQGLASVLCRRATVMSWVLAFTGPRHG